VAFWQDQGTLGNRYVKNNKKMIRERFRTEVFARDKNRCRVCGVLEVPLDAHHITDRNQMPNGGYVKENGIALCNQPGGCHEKAEVFHSTGKSLPGFSPKELYALIGSSLDKAAESSKRLK